MVNFAGISGDFFYAHMDDVAAKASLFERRVAHGYFVLSAAAGLFVDPAPGPVLANYGLDNLRFVKPVYPGDTIQCATHLQAEDGEGDTVGRASAAGGRRVGRGGHAIRATSRWPSIRS